MKLIRCPKCATRVVFQTKEDLAFHITKESGEKKIATYYCVKCDLAFNS